MDRDQEYVSRRPEPEQGNYGRAAGTTGENRMRRESPERARNVTSSPENARVRAENQDPVRVRRADQDSARGRAANQDPIRRAADPDRPRAGYDAPEDGRRRAAVSENRGAGYAGRNVPPPPPGRRRKRKKKKSAAVIAVLLLLILAASALLAYLALNVFNIQLPFLSGAKVVEPSQTAQTAQSTQVTPEPTVSPAENAASPEPVVTPEPEYVYTANRKTLNNAGSFVSASAYSTNGFYSAGWTIAEDGYSYVYRISSIDSQGNVKVLSSYQTMAGADNTENWSNYYSSSSLVSVVPGTDGNPVAMECVSSGGEKTEGENTLTMFRSGLFIRKLDANGAEVSRIELKSGGTAEMPAAEDFRISKDGNYVILTDSGAAVFDPSGAWLYDVSAGGYTSGMILLNDGRIGIAAWGSAGQSLNALSGNSSMIEDSWNLPDSAFAVADGAGEYAFFYSTGIELYGYNAETGDEERILNWSESDLSGVRVSSIVSADGENFSCFTNRLADDGRSYESCLVSLNRTLKSQSVQKQELVLASVYPMEQLQDAVAEFNRNSADARIVLRTFELGETCMETLDYLQLFVEEELDGKMPDLIDMTGLPYEEMAAAGMLEDLYPYLDADSSLGREQILPQILSGLEVSGKLCATCSGFSLSAVIGSKSVIGDRSGWTFDQYNEVTSTMGDGVSVFDGYTTRSTVLYEELGISRDTFINWNDLTCNFNNESFRKLLAFLRTIPEDYAEDPGTISVKNGNQFLERATLFSYDDIILAAKNFNQNEVYVGLPAVDGSGNILNLYLDYAMTSACSDKASAWQFLRMYFTEDYQSGSDSWCFPSNTNAFNAGLEAAKQIVTDETGNYTVRASLYEEGKDPQYFYQLTDAQANTLQNLVNNAKVCLGNEEIFNLVEEQIGGYMDGTESAEAASEAVQNAVREYLSGLKT